MGEYAKHDGHEVKIGTCEDMYYLRLEDCRKVQPIPNSLNPATCEGLRFRLPFPDEDNVQIASAIEAQLDAIVTRAPAGFAHSPIEVLTPAQLLQRLTATTGR